MEADKEYTIVDSRDPEVLGKANALILMARELSGARPGLAIGLLHLAQDILAEKFQAAPTQKILVKEVEDAKKSN